jgi:hypothetical protein
MAGLYGRPPIDPRNRFSLGSVSLMNPIPYLPPVQYGQPDPWQNLV